MCCIVFVLCCVVCGSVCDGGPALRVAIRATRRSGGCCDRFLSGVEPHEPPKSLTCLQIKAFQLLFMQRSVFSTKHFVGVIVSSGRAFTSKLSLCPLSKRWRLLLACNQVNVKGSLCVGRSLSECAFLTRYCSDAFALSMRAGQSQTAPVPAPTGTASSSSSKSFSKSSIAPASASAPAPPPQPPKTNTTKMQQRSDRLVSFLATLVTYPCMFLLTKSAAAVSSSQMAGVRGGGGIDTRKRLADFPEGAALLELERCVFVGCVVLACMQCTESVLFCSEPSSWCIQNRVFSGAFATTTCANSE